jgi:hypothetical protein
VSHSSCHSKVPINAFLPVKFPGLGDKTVIFFPSMSIAVLSSISLDGNCIQQYTLTQPRTPPHLDLKLARRIARYLLVKEEPEARALHSASQNLVEKGRLQLAGFPISIVERQSVAQKMERLTLLYI